MLPPGITIKLFMDGADLAARTRARGADLVSGFTTNPTHLFQDDACGCHRDAEVIAKLPLVGNNFAYSLETVHALPISASCERRAPR